METAAALVAFITIGVQSAKVLHDTIATVKDGPRILSRTAGDIARLEMILKSLQPGIAHIESSEFEQHVRECAKDLEQYAKKIGKLSFSSSDRTLGTLWKRVKMALSEKDLVALQSVVVSHSAQLSLHLQLHQTQISFKTQDDLQTVSQSIKTYEAHGAKRHLTSFQQLSAIERQTTIMSTMIADVNNNIEKAAQADESRSKERQEILELIRQLTDQMAASCSLSQDSQPVQDVSDGKDDDHQADTTRAPKDNFEKLQRIVTSLLALVAEAVNAEPWKLQIHVDDAAVLDSVIRLLECIQLEVFREDHISSMIPPYSMCGPCRLNTLRSFEQELRPLHGALLAARSASIGHGQAKPSTTHGQMTRTVASTSIAYDVGYATLGITTKTRTTNPRKRGYACVEEPDNSQINQGDTDKEVSYRLSITPKKPGKILTMTLNQIFTNGSTICGIPALSEKRVVSNLSPVFEIVSQGRVRDLQELLMRGQASLDDQDQIGSSLLQYASAGYQPEMCEFLIRHGADLDHYRQLTGSWHIVDKFRLPHHQVFPSIPVSGDIHNEEDTKKMHVGVQCVKLLLAAGADPFVVLALQSSDFENPFFGGVLEYMKVLLDHSPYYEIHNLTDYGLTPFLQYCLGGFWTSDGFRLLFERGANIHDRNLRGRSCLHLCGFYIMNGGFSENRCSATIVDALVYLVKSGADPFCTDEDDLSASDSFYLPNGRYWGSFSGDAWDAALVELGYEVADFRRGLPRKARYTNKYKAKDFQAIWKGKEHLCPYYYEDPVVKGDIPNDVPFSEECSDYDYYSSDESSEGGASLGDSDSDS